MTSERDLSVPERSTIRESLEAALLAGDRKGVEILLPSAGAPAAGWKEELLARLTAGVLAGRVPFSALTAAAQAACAFPAEAGAPAVCFGTAAGNTSSTGRDFMGMLLRARGVPALDLGIGVPTGRFLDAVREQGVRFVICIVFSRLDFARVRELDETARALGLRDRFSLLVSGAEMEHEGGAPLPADCGDHRAAAVAEWVVSRWKA